MRMSSNALSAIAKLSGAMIAVDGKVNKHEVAAAILGLAIFDLSSDDAERMLRNADSMSYELAASIVADMNYEAK